MGAEAIRTELKVSEDRRVRAGLRGAIETIAGRHGMTRAEQREFANEVDRECGKATAGNSEAGACCHVVIEEREDRVEVEVRAASRDSRNTDLHAAGSAKSGDSRGSDNGRSRRTIVRQFQKSPTRL